MLTNINTKFKRRLTVAAVAAVAITALVPAASTFAEGWGPERTTFTNKQPATYPVFNSITDNVAVGDERNFVRIREYGSGAKYGDTINNVTPGKEYEVYILYHNDASSNLNESGQGMAASVRVMSSLSSWIVNSSKSSTLSAVISSTNTNPKEVWDSAWLKTESKDDIVLSFVKGSAVIHNAGKANGTVLSESLLSKDGVYIGYNELNGWVPGCAEYSGYITYRVRADQASSTVEKTVSKDGKNFYKTVDTKPGDTLTYKVSFKNTGTLDLLNVTFHDQLPTGVTLVNGTTTLTTQSGTTKLKDLIGANGFNTGLYGAGATAVLTYQVKVNDNIVDDKECKSRNAFKNMIYVDYNVSSKDQVAEVRDSATIYVTRSCGDPEPECEPDDKECICTLDPKNEMCNDPEPTPTPTPTPPSELPKTGPGEVALAIIAVVCIATGGVYWYRSQKDLVHLKNKIDKK